MNRFERTELLLGKEGMNILKKARVAVFGVGGVGGYVAEALARSGIGTLVLIDNDVVNKTNINRQIIATEKTLGLFKVDVAKERIAEINPECEVITHKVFFLPENANLFDFSSYDYVVDAIDTVTGKKEIILRSKAADVPVISSMGAGNKLDPTAFKVADIYQTSVCPLAKVMRSICRKNGIDGLKVVYSEEPPIMRKKESGVGDSEEEKVAKKTVPGSVSFVPPTVGLIIAGEVIKDLVFSGSVS